MLNHAAFAYAIIFIIIFLLTIKQCTIYQHLHYNIVILLLSRLLQLIMTLVSTVPSPTPLLASAVTEMASSKLTVHLEVFELWEAWSRTTSTPCLYRQLTTPS